jgi:hypothetical protein
MAQDIKQLSKELRHDENVLKCIYATEDKEQRASLA